MGDFQRIITEAKYTINKLYESAKQLKPDLTNDKDSGDYDFIEKFRLNHRIENVLSSVERLIDCILFSMNIAIDDCVTSINSLIDITKDYDTAIKVINFMLDDTKETENGSDE